MNLHGSAVAIDSLRGEDASKGFGALVIDEDRLGLACEPVDHHEDRRGNDAE